MRTPEEIKARIDKLNSDGDFFGFQREVLISALPFDEAKSFLKDDVTADQWAGLSATTDEAAMAAAADYFKFAIGKALNHRGISAKRSVDKMTAYVWLLGRDDVLLKMEAADYPNYGVPILKAAADELGFDQPAAGVEGWAPEDVEMWENMAQGRPCHPNCDEGCGS